MEHPTFPLFCVDSVEKRILAAGGGGEERYGIMNGLIVYDEALKPIIYHKTDDVVKKMCILKEGRFFYKILLVSMDKIYFLEMKEDKIVEIFSHSAKVDNVCLLDVFWVLIKGKVYYLKGEKEIKISDYVEESSEKENIMEPEKSKKEAKAKGPTKNKDVNNEHPDDIEINDKYHLVFCEVENVSNFFFVDKKMHTVKKINEISCFKIGKEYKVERLKKICYKDSLAYLSGGLESILFYKNTEYKKSKVTTFDSKRGLIYGTGDGYVSNMYTKTKVSVFPITGVCYYKGSIVYVTLDGMIGISKPRNYLGLLFLIIVLSIIIGIAYKYH